jgi:hypothetical protein
LDGTGYLLQPQAGAICEAGSGGYRRGDECLEVLARVFEPFFTTKFQRRARAMAAVYGIVQNHGGDIFIKSEAQLWHFG